MGGRANADHWNERKRRPERDSRRRHVRFRARIRNGHDRRSGRQQRPGAARRRPHPRRRHRGARREGPRDRRQQHRRHAPHAELVRLADRVDPVQRRHRHRLPGDRRRRGQPAADTDGRFRYHSRGCDDAGHGRRARQRRRRPHAAAYRRESGLLSGNVRHALARGRWRVRLHAQFGPAGSPSARRRPDGHRVVRLRRVRLRCERQRPAQPAAGDGLPHGHDPGRERRTSGREPDPRSGRDGGAGVLVRGSGRHVHPGRCRRHDGALRHARRRLGVARLARVRCRDGDL